MLDQRTLLQWKPQIVTHKSDASRRLAAASARLRELAHKGESSVDAELLRRIVSVGQNTVDTEDSDALSASCGTVVRLRDDTGGFAEAKRMRDAIDVALALLDELLELLPHDPRRDMTQDIADIFHEISEIAALGESAARKAMEDEADDIRGHR
jgi:hypothetical protein